MNPIIKNKVCSFSEPPKHNSNTEYQHLAKSAAKFLISLYIQIGAGVPNLWHVYFSTLNSSFSISSISLTKIMPKTASNFGNVSINWRWLHNWQWPDKKTTAYNCLAKTHTIQKTVKWHMNTVKYIRGFSSIIKNLVLPEW